MGEGVEVELSKTFTFGKRSAGIALARSENELTKALLADYFRNRVRKRLSLIWKH